MPRRLIAATAVAAGMSVVLLGCTGGPARTVTSPPPVAGSTAGSAKGAPAGPARYRARPVTMADARRCPVTIGHPVPGTMWWRDLLFGWGSAYGNGSLWVGGLWPHGVVIVTKDDVGPDGRLGMKFGWYRLTNGYLTITGRRLDAPAPPGLGAYFPRWLRADRVQCVRGDIPRRGLLAGHRPGRPGRSHLRHFCHQGPL